MSKKFFSCAAADQLPPWLIFSRMLLVIIFLLGTSVHSFIVPQFTVHTGENFF